MTTLSCSSSSSFSSCVLIVGLLLMFMGSCKHRRREEELNRAIMSMRIQMCIVLQHASALQSGKKLLPIYQKWFETANIMICVQNKLRWGIIGYYMNKALFWLLIGCLLGPIGGQDEEIRGTFLEAHNIILKQKLDGYSDGQQQLVLFCDVHFILRSAHNLSSGTGSFLYMYFYN